MHSIDYDIQTATRHAEHLAKTFAAALQKFQADRILTTFGELYDALVYLRKLKRTKQELDDADHS